MCVAGPVCVAENRWAKWYMIKHRCLKSLLASKFTGVINCPKSPLPLANALGAGAWGIPTVGGLMVEEEAAGLLDSDEDRDGRRTYGKTTSSSFAALYQAC